jgi:hypothetical protein
MYFGHFLLIISKKSRWILSQKRRIVIQLRHHRGEPRSAEGGPGV